MKIKRTFEALPIPLDPCPFCGSTPVLEWTIDPYTGEWDPTVFLYHYSCPNEKCPAYKPKSWYESQAVALGKWNARYRDMIR